MHSRNAVGCARPADNLTTHHPCPLRDSDRRQVGDRNLESRHRLDRDREHSCHRPGERHQPGDRCQHGLSERSRVVHPPVARLRGRGVAGGDGAIHGSNQTDRGDQQSKHHLPSPQTYLYQLTVSRGLALGSGVMAAIRLGLMGFGRIGRNVFRLLHGKTELEVVAIADIADPAALTYLLKYDSLYGRFPGEIHYSDGVLTYDSRAVAFTDFRTPADTRWGELGVDVVLDTTSRYRSRSALEGHLDSGAHRVVLTSSPETPGEIPLLLRGINDELLDEDPPIVALGSNTSNAATPILATLSEAFGLERAFITTVKAMSNAGRLADVPTDSFRTSRAAGENIIPAETNSAEIITQVLPELEGKLVVTALNVPVADGSTVDMVAQVGREVTAGEVNEAIRQAAETRYRGVIAYVEDPIVSSDVRMDPHSGIFDSLATMVTGGDLVKTITWFNNGWGYSNRVVEVASAVAAQLVGGSA